MPVDCAADDALVEIVMIVGNGVYIQQEEKMKTE